MSSPHIYFYDLGGKCMRCGATENLEIHHKNRNRKNNDVGNLMVLCGRCHMAEHYGNHIYMGKRKLIDFICPPSLLERFDAAWHGSYKTRTEALLTLMQRFVDEHK